MDQIRVLFCGDWDEYIAEFRRTLRDGPYRTHVASDDGALFELLNEPAEGIVILAHHDPKASIDLCRRLRSDFYGCPIQIIILGAHEDWLEQATDAGVDDFLVAPINGLEFQYRVRAAAIRLRTQLRLLEERDFFRRAAKQEEELSSRILDQHMILKQAFQNIEHLNRELEDTNARLEKVARYDILSGLLNRMSLFGVIDMEIERTMRTKMPLSGIMVDIDNFKQINDEHGHLAGDQVISEIGKRLRNHLRKYDQAGRYGGEEFFVVLPNTNLHQAYIIAERFRHGLAERAVVLDETEVRITASFGIAEYRHGETRESWIARSDRNMYVAKQSGRNRVVAE